MEGSMTTSIALGTAALRSVLTAAHHSGPGSGVDELDLLLCSLFALLPCDCVRWTRSTAGPIAAMEIFTYPASISGHTAAAAGHELRLDLAHPTGALQTLSFRRDIGPMFSPADRLLLALLEPHLRSALRRIGFPSPHLTAREVQVLRCVREGMGNAQIARQLHVAESTVVKHLEHVFSRTGAHSRTEAVRLCEPLLR
jgi:DNA-binding CsgD family transcriptional regulator